MDIRFNGHSLTCQQTTVYPAPYLERKKTTFVAFRVENGGDLVIRYDRAPQSVCVRPLSLKQPFTVSGNEVTLHLERACNLSVEINGSIEDALLVFATANDQANPADYRHVVRFSGVCPAAGVVHIPEDDTLLILEEGAVVHGKIYAEHKKHIAVSGLGTVTMERYERTPEWTLTMDFRFCTDVLLEHFVIADSSSWSCRIWGCEDVHIEGIRIIGHRGNSDGIDVCGSRRVLVENCFTRVWDDSLVVKAFDTGDEEDITFRNCTLWNDFARPIEVGVELRATHVRNIRFENIDILHSPTGYPLMGIHHGDRAEVSNIVFENIRTEDTPGAQLFDVRITDSVWNTDQVKGGVRDLIFRDIFINDASETLPSNPRLQGFSEEAGVQHVVLQNIRKNGQTVSSLEELGLDVRAFVKDVVLLPGDAPALNWIHAELEEPKTVCKPDGTYTAALRLLLQNKSTVPETVSGTLRISPARPSQYGDVPFSCVLQPGEQQVITAERALPPGKYCIHVESMNRNLASAWQLISLPLVLPETMDNAPVLTFETCRGEVAGTVQLALMHDFLHIKSTLLQEGALTLYAAKPVPMAANQVLFSVEETDSGSAPAIINGAAGLETAPQLRCPAEITYVFKNEPKVEKIVKWTVMQKPSDECFVPLTLLGLEPGTKQFWLELSAKSEIQSRYPICLFGSQVPDEICHMFAETE